MNIGLNKRQLQQTLREMGIDFPSDASRDDLKAILDQANQRQWLRNAHRNSPGRNGRVIRRRGPKIQPAVDKVPPPRISATVPQQPPPSIRHPNAESISKPGMISTPSPEFKTKVHPNMPVFDRTKDLEAYALKRANGICDLCDQRPAHGSDDRRVELKPCFFMDPPEDRPRTFKMVAALCPDCFKRVGTSPVLSDLKVLKRKVRQTRTKEITITKKKRHRAARKPTFTRDRK